MRSYYHTIILARVTLCSSLTKTRSAIVPRAAPLGTTPFPVNIENVKQQSESRDVMGQGGHTRQLIEATGKKMLPKETHPLTP